MRETESLQRDMANTGGRFERYRGQEKEVLLPSCIEGEPLCVIGTKAFLSCKTIERLVLPDSVVAVEDWGFAHMKNLREIRLPARDILFGKKVFLGCDSLRKVCLSGNVACYEGIPFFLAAMFRFFPEESLEKLRRAGDVDEQWEWLADYDKAFAFYIRRPNDYGFEPAFIGWFDIEDVDDQKQRYVLEQRRNKVMLTFQRLLYDRRLEEGNRLLLQEFLTGESALIAEMCLDGACELGRDVRYYKIWREAGGLDEKRAKALLAQIPEGDPEVRAYLLTVQLEQAESGSFFEAFDL